MPKLSDSDRDIIRRARELAEAVTMDDLRPLLGRDADVDERLVRAEALGKAQYLLAELADRLERLGA